MDKYAYLIKRLAQESPFDLRADGAKTKALAFATLVSLLLVLATGVPGSSSKTSEPTFYNVENPGLTEVKEAVTYESLPQIVTTDNQIRKYSTVEYEAKEAKTVSSVARKFGVSQDTIRWANGITGDEIKAGDTLEIPPMSGLEYKIKTGDSIESIAAYYSADPEEVVSFNGIQVRSLTPGETLFVPDGIKPKPVLRWTNDPSGHNTATISRVRTPTYSGNGYPWGNCTWYVSNRRAELGHPVPNKLGNARSWAYRTAAQGFSVDHTPSFGAVFAESGTNHVAVVESVNPDGSITISEMNYNWRLGVKTTRTIPAGSVSRHSYIH